LSTHRARRWAGTGSFRLRSYRTASHAAVLINLGRDIRSLACLRSVKREFLTDVSEQPRRDPIGCPETSLRTAGLRNIKSQDSADLVYTVAEACNPGPFSTSVFVASEMAARRLKQIQHASGHDTMSDSISLAVARQRSGTPERKQASEGVCSASVYEALLYVVNTLIVTKTPFRRACSVAPLLRTVNIRVVCCSF
jgi:hypothetical protein